MRGNILVVTVVVTALCSGQAFADFVKPWDDLVTDPLDNEPSWIGSGVTVYTVNAGTYTVGFDESKSKNNYAAAGMNSVTFVYGGSNTGHLVGAPSGTFAVRNGKDNTFAELLLVIAVSAASLPGDFSCTITGPEWTAPGDPGGTNSNARDLSDDFVWYNPAGYATGRPSGYYADFMDETVAVEGTDPDHEGFTYAFDNGMVTVFSLRGLSIGPYGGTADIDYAFENLPGKAVFSVYAKLSDLDRVKHTNRSTADNRGGTPVSTFEVKAVPEPCVTALLACGLPMLLVWRHKWTGRRV